MRFARSVFTLFSAILIAAGLAPSASAQYAQQAHLSPTNGNGLGATTAISGDGNTAIVGSPLDNNQNGTASFFVRTGAAWSQQGGKMAPTDASNFGHFGSSVALSADGNTAILGASGTFYGGAYIFTRSNGVWTQQGSKLLGTSGPNHNPGYSEGSAVAMSADGNTALVGAAEADGFWVFTRSGNTWTQQGDKLVGTGEVGPFVRQGSAIAISADGNTAIVGANGDNGNTGAAWVFNRNGGAWSQQGTKLVGAGAAAIALQDLSVAISADGNTALVGRTLDNSSTGAAWVFTRSNGTWNQQGGKLTGTGAVGKAQQGSSVALSGDGNTAVIGGSVDNTLRGAAWVFKRAGGVWAQQGSKLAGTPNGGFLGTTMAITPDAATLIVGGGADAWIFAGPASSTPTPGGASPASGTGGTQVFTFNFSDPGGWQALTVVDVLINSALDGRQACYVAFQPTGANAGSVFLVDDAGDAGGPYSGMVLPGSQVVSNSQCTITGTGSSVATSGDGLTLTLAITFTPGFAGNRIFYSAAQDAASNSGWQPLGTWNVPGAGAAGPAVTGVTNAHATGLTQIYTFTFTDPNGWQDLTVTNVLINGAINGVGACFLAFVPMGANSGAIDLVDDAGDGAGPYAGLVLPASSAVSNSQCSISGTGSSISAGGNTIQLTLAITFSASFGGNRIIYAAAGSSTKNSGWQAVGTVTVQ